MGYIIEVQSEALIEMREAFQWYELQKAGLGFELLNVIELCYQKLSENPQYFSMINHRYRRIRTNPFPYFLIYEIEESRVIINSFFMQNEVGIKFPFPNCLRTPEIDFAAV